MPQRPVIRGRPQPGGGDQRIAGMVGDRAGAGDRRAAQRATQEDKWVEEAVRVRFGTHGLARARKFQLRGQGPFAREAELALKLTSRQD